MSAPKKRLPMRKIRAAVHTHLRASELGRRHFKASGDALDLALTLGLSAGSQIKLKDGRTFMLEDQFAEKNTAFSAKMFQRFTLKEVKPVAARPAARKEGGAA